MAHNSPEEKQDGEILTKKLEQLLASRGDFLHATVCLTHCIDKRPCIPFNSF